jgi:L-ascorbate metabolism protein UlaG (beta-lactamase superfamily)
MQFRKLGLGAFMAVALSVPAFAQSADDKIGDVSVHAYQHASLSLAAGGKTVLIDPAPSRGQAPEAALALFKAGTAPDVILVTHAHGDHFSADVIAAVATSNTAIVAPAGVAAKMPEALKGQVKIMANGDKAEVNGVSIEAVPAYNVTEDRLKYHAKGDNNGYVVTMAGKRIYIAGDTEGTPELKALTNIDAAFIPMNLPFTQTQEEAAAWVKAFKPKTVYPYHYANADLAAFKAGVGTEAEIKTLKWY